MPERFSEERDDRLMNSLIQNYAIEMKDKDGNPTGHFFCDRDGALDVSKEVANTHFSKDAAKQSGLLLDRFDETWNHFDVNHDGIVEVGRMPQFLRYLLGNALAIGLQ